MPIRASSSQQIDALLSDLSSGRSVQREAAVARLTVLGARAVDRLIAVADSNSPSLVRAAAFRALEGIGDPRAVDSALRGVASPDVAVASAAMSAARVLIRGKRGAAIVDALTAVALDTSRPEQIRLGALRALMDLGRTTIAPLIDTLASDPSDAIRAQAATASKRRRQAAANPDEKLAAAARELPDDPRAVGAIIVSAGNSAALSLLLSIVERIREREQTEPPSRRLEWTTVRAGAHHAIAKRGSRIALYDLRESLESARGPLPVEFLSALSEIGDASCLESIAGAYARSADTAAMQDTWWRDRLATVFTTIVRREKLTRRHAVVKKIEKRWKKALDELLADDSRASRESRRSGKSGGSA